MVRRTAWTQTTVTSPCAADCGPVPRASVVLLVCKEGVMREPPSLVAVGIKGGKSVCYWSRAWAVGHAQGI